MLRSSGSSSRWLLFLLLAAGAAAQDSATPSQTGRPVPYTSVSELNMLLSQLEQTSQGAQLDLAKLRIEKWKTDANTKHGSQTDVESIERNLQHAMPEIIGQLRSSPESLSATFKLYRNLDALYDVFGSVVESAGAFGSRDEFQSLQNDFDGFERARRAVADRMETLATSKEDEVVKLRSDLQKAQAAQVPPAPPKKVVVDDTEPAKPPVKKKPKSTKPVAVPKPPAGTESQPQPQTAPQ